VVVAGTHDGAVRLWDAKGRELPPLEKPSARAIASLAFCPTNAGVLAVAAAAGDARSEVKVWDLSRREAVTLPGNKRVYAVAFSPDGKTLACGADGPAVAKSDGVKLWEVAEWRKVPRGPDVPTKWKEGITLAWEKPDARRDIGAVVSVAFDPRGKYLAAGGFGPASANNEGIVRLWEVPSGKEVLRKSFGRNGVVGSVAFSPDGGTLAVATGTDVRLWDVAKRKERAGFSVLGKAGGSLLIESLAFAPDGKTLAVGWESVKLFDVRTLEESADLQIGDGTKLKIEGNRAVESPAVAKVAFSADGTTLVGTGWVGKKEKEGFVRVWVSKGPPARKEDPKGPSRAPAGPAGRSKPDR
jgi:WD40 repeat protein